MTGTSDQRQKAERRGRWAETLAVLYLRLKGYRIVARRMRTTAGEIDLIARKGRTLVFAEVKARADLDTSISAVTQRQRLRITRAAESFVRGRPDLADMNWRFDLIAAAGALRLRHLEDAWRPGLK